MIIRLTEEQVKMLKKIKVIQPYSPSKASGAITPTKYSLRPGAEEDIKNILDIYFYEDTKVGGTD